MTTTWQSLNKQIIACERCPRLRRHCLQIAKEKRKSFAEWDYWGKPVENFGDNNARLLIVGLAPAAHGANRTGRMFTGDRSGDWLYRALHKAGFANQANATARDDGLQLIDCAITAVAHCAPPDNKPETAEIDNCERFLSSSFEILPIQVIIALGGTAWTAALKKIRALDWLEASPATKVMVPKFTHGARLGLRHNRLLLGSYHPSQQNTFTGRLTEPMFDAIFSSAKSHLVSL